MKLSRLIKTYNYSTVQQSNSVIILFAGPTTAKHKHDIVNYADKNDSLVIGSNYSYESLGIKSTYTYVANDFKLSENEALINNDIIVPGRIYSGEKTKEETKQHFRNHIKRGFNVYMAGDGKLSTTYKLARGPIEIRKDGFLPYGRFSSAGHGAMLMSIVCRPKKMLIVGLDGPTDITCKEKVMFNGKKVPYNKPHKNESFKNHFVNVILPSIVHFGIKLETFGDVNIYGLNKKQLGFTVL